MVVIFERVVFGYIGSFCSVSISIKIDDQHLCSMGGKP
jgi:hypothetical protein